MHASLLNNTREKNSDELHQIKYMILWRLTMPKNKCNQEFIFDPLIWMLLFQ